MLSTEEFRNRFRWSSLYISAEYIGIEQIAYTKACVWECEQLLCVRDYATSILHHEIWTKVSMLIFACVTWPRFSVRSRGWTHHHAQVGSPTAPRTAEPGEPMSAWWRVQPRLPTQKRGKFPFNHDHSGRSKNHDIFYTELSVVT